MTRIEKHINQLKTILTEGTVTSNETIKAQHAQDESYHQPAQPDIVVFPKSKTEVSQILAFANQNNMAVTPFGLGSSLEGHVIPYHQGITIDFTDMKQIIEIKDKDFLVKVQPGVTRTALNQQLNKKGLFFPIDPGADATLGGMAATNASGTTTVKYGVMRDQIRDMEVVLADGTIINTGSQSKKSSSGLHLNGLFTGSEGILGCITELTLQVHGLPEYTLAATATFPTIKNATEAVINILQAGIPIARVELVDEASIIQVNKHNDTSFTVAPTLFMEFHGNEAGLEQDVAFMKEIVKEHACESIHFESDQAKRNELWQARHQLAYAYIHGHPGKKMMVTDVCLPITALADAVTFAREALEATNLPGGIVGHVGDGNFHVLLMIDLNDTKEVQLAHRYNEQLVEYALACHGTCTGEHGVGVGKQKYQAREHGDAYQVMQNIKKGLDPNNIMNPGKLINAEKSQL